MPTHPDKNNQDVIASRNPNNEAFEQHVNLEKYSEVSRILAELYETVPREMKSGGYWSIHILLSLESLKDLVAESMGVNPENVEIYTHLKNSRPEATTIKKSDGKYSIVLQDYLNEREVDKFRFEFTKIERHTPEELLSELSKRLSSSLAHWIKSLVHEMYHVRQAQTPVYQAQTEASNEDRGLYDADLGERAAPALSVRAMREIVKHLDINRHQQFIIDLEDQIELVLYFLKAKSETKWKSEVHSPVKKRRDI